MLTLHETTLLAGVASRLDPQATCGSYHTAAVTDMGELYTWGGGMYGKVTLARERRGTGGRLALQCAKAGVGGGGSGAGRDGACGNFLVFVGRGMMLGEFGAGGGGFRRTCLKLPD